MSVCKIAFILAVIITDYIKAAALGSESVFWKWVSVSVSITSILLIILSEIVVFRNRYFKPVPPNSSVDASKTKNKRQFPTLKESSVEIKQNPSNVLNTEKENLIK